MKNREKYREEILKCAEIQGRDPRDPCDFKTKVVFPHFGKDGCTGISCAWCNVLFDIWLDEEYEEPPKPEVDWSKVPVDTLVRVRNYENREWCLRYFKGFDKSNSGGKYEAWSNGMTSKTASDSSNIWKYCELVEDEEAEDDWYNVPVDTPVRVRDDKRDMWILRYFKGIDDSRSDRYMAWTCGDTSKTSFGSYKHWEYCELVEDEDGSN